jgi:hypothetical protein
MASIPYMVIVMPIIQRALMPATALNERVSTSPIDRPQQISPPLNMIERRLAALPAIQPLLPMRPITIIVVEVLPAGSSVLQHDYRILWNW